MADEALREPTFFILTALAKGRLHGYGIMQAVLELSEGRVRLRAGTVYGALERLETEGWVAADGDELESGRTRRYFRLCELGEQALTVETARLAANVRAARRALRAKAAPVGRLA